MVNKQMRNTKPPDTDEAWWTALLKDEDRLVSALQEGQSAKEALSERDGGGERLPGKTTPMDWAHIQRLYSNDETICLQVTGYNRGGLLVVGEGMHGFVPVSHLLEVQCRCEEAERESALSGYSGKPITLKIIEFDPERGRVVFSERAALAGAGMRNQLFGGIKPGDTVCGTVTNITDFGVFVDLGGVEGLIHVSEMSWGRVRHPSDIIKIGDLVTTHVLQVDRNRSRIALSLKRLCTNPWETAAERYHTGDVVEATITSIVPFGVFARLEEGLDGLIHATELGPNPAVELQEGSLVRVMVLSVDALHQRLGLSLKLKPESVYPH